MNENFYDNFPTARQLTRIEIRNLRKVHESEKLLYATLAVTNFVYFTANFPMPFEKIIQKAFEESGQLAVDHLTSKFKGLEKKYSDLGYFPAAGVIDFFFALDNSNQRKLISWVQANYHFSSDHK